MDNTVEVWNLADGSHAEYSSVRLGGSPRWPIPMAFSSNGQRLAVVSGDELVLWDIEQHKSKQISAGQMGSVESVIFSPDDRYLAAIGDNHTIKVWNAADYHQTAEWVGHGGTGATIAFSPDNRLLASAGEDCNSVLWELATGARVRSLPIGHEPLGPLAFSPDGRTIAAAGAAGTVSLWQADTGAQLANLRLQTDTVAALAFDATGQTLVSTSRDGSMVIWDVPQRTHLVQLNTSESPGLGAVAVGVDGGIVAAGNAAILSWTRGQLPFAGHISSVETVTYGPDGKHVTAMADDNTLITWDATRKRTARTVLPLTNHFTRSAVSPNRQQIAVHKSGMTSIYDTLSQQPLTQLPGPILSLAAPAFSPDSQLIAVTDTSENAIGVWQLPNRQRIAKIDTGPGIIVATAFHPNRKALSTVTANGLLETWDLTSGRQLSSGVTAVSPANAIAYDPTGRLLANTSGGAIQLWDTTGRQPRPIAMLPAHKGHATALAFSPDGRLLATAGDDHKATIWDIETRTLLAVLTGHTDTVRSLDWSPAGNTLLTGSADRTITEWTINADQAVNDLCHRLPGFGQPPPDSCPKSPPHK